MFNFFWFAIKKKYKIFAVDDEDNNLRLLERLLSDDYEVILSKDSLDVPQKIKAENPDIILLDVFMPKINGFEVCKLVLANPDTKDIPIIFISSITKAEHIEKGLSLGAVDFISKPISKVETLARIKNHLKSSQLKQDLEDANTKLNVLLEKKSHILDEQESQSKRINAKLSESEQRFELLFQAAPTAIVMVSVDSGEIVDANSTCCNLSGYEYFEIVGLNQNDLLQPSDEKISENYFQTKDSVSDTNNVRMSLNTLIKKDGAKIPVQNSSKTLLAENELYIFSTIIDLSARMEMENQLLQAKDKAEEMNRIKGIFLANISHELRTPLVGIMGFSQLLISELEDDGLRHFAQAISESGKRLLNTLKVLIDYSQLESNKGQPNWSKVNLNSIITEIVEENRVELDTEKLKIISKLPNYDIWVDADESFVIEAVSQLLTNAINYTNVGNIVVSLYKENIENKVFAVIEIEDTGVGISEEKLNLIFDDFRQGSEGYTREYEGLGLGLALVKKIVTLHDGKIFVKSEVNKGSLFKITLELKNRTN